MKLEVNIDKKFAFMIIGSILILAGAIYVYAQNPAVFGHSVGEVDWSEPIPGNLQVDGEIEDGERYIILGHDGEDGFLDYYNIHDEGEVYGLSFRHNGEDKMEIRNDGTLHHFGSARVYGDLQVDGEIIGGGSVSLGVNNCYVVLPNRWTTAVCKDDFYLKGLYKYTDNNWDGFGVMCCESNPSEPTRSPYETAETVDNNCPWTVGGVRCESGNYGFWPSGVSDPY